MSEFAGHLAQTFVALLPVVNPVGSALVLLGLIGQAEPAVIRTLARKIAVNTLLFLFVIDVAGAAVLKLFGISLPVVQLAGGLVLAAMGWGLLNRKDTPDQGEAAPVPPDPTGFQCKVFYPFTFPLTAGPGTLVVTLTLSAHASKGTLLEILLAHLGVLAGMILMCVAVYVCYANAPVITKKVSPATAQGIVRVIAFLLLCIGVQIAWTGFSHLQLELRSMTK